MNLIQSRRSTKAIYLSSERGHRIKLPQEPNIIQTAQQQKNTTSYIKLLLQLHYVKWDFVKPCGGTSILVAVSGHNATPIQHACVSKPQQLEEIQRNWHHPRSTSVAFEPRTLPNTVTTTSVLVWQWMPEKHLSFQLMEHLGKSVISLRTFSLCLIRAK